MAPYKQWTKRVEDANDEERGMVVLSLFNAELLLLPKDAREQLIKEEQRHNRYRREQRNETKPPRT